MSRSYIGDVDMTYIRHELLARVNARLQDAAKWTQGAYARDSGGKECDPLSKDAVRFSAIGSLVRETHDFGIGQPERWIVHSMLDFYSVIGQSLLELNENHGYTQLMDAIEKYLLHMKTLKRKHL